MVLGLSSAYRRRFLTGRLLAGAAPLALLGAGGAAQAQSASADIVEEVVVTGSQLARTGFDTPTPVTVVSLADVQRVAAPNIADALNQLPALKPSVTPQSTTNISKLAGGNYLDLRGLSYLRTLTLIDGKRYVPASPEGVVNVNTIPQAVIGGVEVVTGGASAAYGSDAVAGVINFKLDHRLEGARGSVQYGVSDRGDRENVLLSAAFGSRFADGRGHVLLGAEYADTKGVPRLSDRSWGRSGQIANPASTPTNAAPSFVLASDSRVSNAAYGGVINSATGANGTALLRGLEFLSGGQVGRFDYGTMTTATQQNGGSGVLNAGDNVLEQPYDRWAIFGTGEFELRPGMTLYGNLSYSGSSLFGDNITGNDQIVIQRDNPFIPAAVRSVLDADPSITNFTMGRSLNDYARGVYDQEAWTWQATGGVRGDLNETWSYDLSFAYGESRNNTIFRDARNTAKWRDALDVVDNPNTPGVDPVCRSTLTDPSNGCIPLNLFGPLAPGEQSAAVASILGDSVRDWRQRQEVADIVVRGAPWALPAGDLSVAVGLHARTFKSDVLSDPISETRPGGNTVYRVGNTIPFSGKETVREAFAEVLIPILADTAFAKRLEVDLAGRITDYKTSGQVETWKAGLNYTVNDMVRFRATRSRDIRAPNLQELFAAGQTLIFNINDTLRGESYLVSTTQAGNPNLKPEKADTLTAGVVLQPLPRLRLSLDYYNIEIEGAIAALSASQIATGCLNGDQALCALTMREPSTNGTSPGRFVSILLAPANFQSIKTDGFDFEASYNVPVGPGQLDMRALVTFTNKLDLLGVAGAKTKLAGNLAQPLVDGVNGTSHWRGQAMVGYRVDGYRFDVTGRYVGGGVVTRDVIASKPTAPVVEQRKRDGRFYVDLSAEAAIRSFSNGGEVAAFGSILNLLDEDPPITGYDGFAAPRQLFDLIGRQYNMGIKFKF